MTQIKPDVLKEDFHQIPTLFETKYAKLSNGETLGYRETGQGLITLLMIHGNLKCSLNFESLMQKLSSLIKCVAIDLRGCGFSTKNKSSSSFEDMAEDVECFIHEYLNIKKFFLLGDKEGGAVCYAYGKLYPGKIQGMIISNFVSPMGYKIKIFEGGKITSQESIANYQKLQRTKKIKEFSTIYAKRVGMDTTNSKQVEKDFLIMKQQKNLLKIQKLLVQYNYHDDLRNTIFNVKVLLGVNDPVYLIEFGADFKEVFKDRVEVIGFMKGGHFLLETNLDIATKHILKFINANVRSKKEKSELNLEEEGPDEKQKGEKCKILKNRYFC